MGIDVGGTFTDVIAVDSLTGKATVLKLPTSRVPSVAVVRGVCKVGRPASISTVCHATTLATNALLTRTGLARTALVTNEGFRDVLEIGRQRRPEVYDLGTRRPPPLVRRRHRFTLRARTSSDGAVLQPLDEGEAASLARLILKERFESVAVSFLNSYANSEQEEEVRRILRDQGFRGHVSISAEIDREFREYERTSTTVVNAVLQPLVSTYLRRLSVSLRDKGVEAPVYIMNSDGGMATLVSAAERPFASIESGPAAGVLASRELATRLSLKRAITFDMGGTTAKAGAVINGEPDITYEFEAAGRTHSGRSITGSGYVVRGPFIDVAEVSAGGGTVALIDDGGALSVGPTSAGSEPGPACYGKGGREPTVTDANLILGRINPRYLLGGSMPLRPELARKAFSKLSSKLGMSVDRVAEGVIRLVNNSMCKAISIVSVERGRDPREFSMIAFGGAGPVHCCDLAEELGIKEVIVPVHAGLFSAYGLLVGELSRTFALPVSRRRGPISAYFERLGKMAAAEMKHDGFPDFTSHEYVDARYAGQSHELTLPFEGEAGLRTSFDSMHRRLYGYSSTDGIEVVNARLRVAVRRGSTVLLSSAWGRGKRRPGRRSVWFASRRLRVPVYTREEMRLGDAGVGPCVIEEYDSTLVVNPSWRWRLEDYGARLTR